MSTLKYVYEIFNKHISFLSRKGIVEFTGTPPGHFRPIYRQQRAEAVVTSNVVSESGRCSSLHGVVRFSDSVRLSFCEIRLV